MQVVEDDDLRSSITKCVTKDSNLQFWNNVTKTYINRNTNNRSVQIDSILRDNRRTIFEFNGSPVKLQILDNTKKDDMKEDGTKVAHQQIVSHIVIALNQSIIKSIKDEFTSKEGRVYTAR